MQYDLLFEQQLGFLSEEGSLNSWRD